MFATTATGFWPTPYGTFFLLAIATSWLLSRRNAVAEGVDPSHIDLLLPVIVLLAVAVATAASAFAPIAGSADPGVRVRVFAVLLAGMLTLVVYGRLCKLSVPRLMDIFA